MNGSTHCRNRASTAIPFHSSPMAWILPLKSHLERTLINFSSRHRRQKQIKSVCVTQIRFSQFEWIHWRIYAKMLVQLPSIALAAALREHIQATRASGFAWKLMDSPFEFYRMGYSQQKIHLMQNLWLAVGVFGGNAANAGIGIERRTISSCIFHEDHHHWLDCAAEVARWLSQLPVDSIHHLNNQFQ